MAATRNGNPTRTAGVSMTPAASPIPNTQTTVNNLFTSTAAVNGAVAQAALLPEATAQRQSIASFTQQQPVTTMMATPSLLAPRTTVLSPIVALAGTSYPFIIPAVIFTPRPAPLRKLTERDITEETLTLDTYTFSNGRAILDVSSLRCDLISLISFRPIYDDGGRTLTRFGRYFDDLNQASNVRDSLRKYTLINSLGSGTSTIGTALTQISRQLSGDIANASATVASLDALIRRTKRLSEILDIKSSLGGDYTPGLTNPNMGLQRFMSSRMLFSDSAYTIFSDTKIIYQVLADLTGILEKCSFNLLDGFTDEERRVLVSNPITIKKQTIQDAITIDQSYGDNLAYTPTAIRLKYMNSTVDMNGLLNALPSGSRNRFKFIINLLSKEFKVSKGMGKYRLEDTRYFGISNAGNPFDNIIGRVPSDIFLEPLGQNSLSSLFYIKGGASNVVILPFEGRQVVGDNETVFVPGATYFADSILKGNFDAYNSYRDIFGTRFTKAKNIFENYLLKQSGIDTTSANLDPKAMLKNALRLYNDSQNYIRKDNNDPTTLLTFVMLLVSNGDPSIKFEVYKLLLLITLYDARPTVTQQTAQTDKFRDLLFGELSGQSIQGFSDRITETNISSLLSTQIEIVKKLVLGKIPPLSVSSTQNIGQQKSNTAANTITAQKQQLGLPVAKARSITTSNQNNNTATVQVQQFSRLADALKGNQNLFKNTIDFARTLFTAASTNNTAHHLLDNSSVSRYNAMTMSGFLLLAFELFSNLADQFARTTVIYNLIDGAGGKSESSQYIQLSYIGNELSSTSDSIKQYIGGGIYSNPIIADYDKKLGEEEQIIGNILAFFDRINQNLSSVTSLSTSEGEALNLTTANNARTIASTRTAKNILKTIVDKRKLYNPRADPAADFYLPAGKAISDKSYAALKIALRDHSFLTGRKKIISVGIPKGFTQAAMGARLDKTDAYQGNLQRTTSDLAQISIHKLDKHDEGIIYKPITYKFDLSLFAGGYERYNLSVINNLNYSTLLSAFEFYDFDEDKEYSEVLASRISVNGGSLYLLTDPYYRTRQALGREVVSNLQTSFLLELYVHLLTGMNITEETFIQYTEAETRGFIAALRSLSTGAPNFTGVKLMSPVYQGLLAAFANSDDDFKLMLTLCNDIPSSVFREKQYDRTFMVMVDVDKFAIDENAMKQTPAGANMLSEMRLKNRILSSHTSYHDNLTGQRVQNTNLYKTPDNFIMDQYFAEVELVQE